MAGSGKRAAARPPRQFRPVVLLYAGGITLAVVGWGYLVKAAIDFGVQGRNGTSGAWLYLALASAGAMACLFIGLMLVARLLRSLGVTSAPSSAPPADAPPRPVGGRRASR